MPSGIKSIAPIHTQPAQERSNVATSVFLVRQWWFQGNDWAPKLPTYKPGDFLAIRPLNWDDRIDKDHDDENLADPRALSGGRGRSGDGNDNDNGEGEEDTQGGGKGTSKGKGTKDGKGKGNATKDGRGKGQGYEKGNCKGEGIVKQTPGADGISRAVALQLQKEMSVADLDLGG